MVKLPAQYVAGDGGSTVTQISGSLLLETGGTLLLETGFDLLLEDTEVTPKIPAVWNSL